MSLKPLKSRRVNLFEKRAPHEPPELEPRKRRSFPLRFRHLALLAVLWLLLIHHFERYVVYSALGKCKWARWEHWDHASPHHSVVIGDPQIVDAYSYPSRPAPLMALTRCLADNYLHRNYVITHNVLKQHSTIFVGDLFDGGREWANDVWFEEYARFFRIFPHQDGNRVFTQVPGNHDIGFGDGVNYTVYNRFRTYFGAADTYFTVGNHSLVLLDTVSLSNEQDAKVRSSSESFLAALSDETHPAKRYPRIAVSHVPMYRTPEMQLCGPLRESKRRFPIVKGLQYQTVIEYGHSRDILDGIEPALILSGDDHDYCHVRHPLHKSGLDASDHQYSETDKVGVDYTEEITVKSSAMTGGISRPAIQLLSLWNPIESTDYNTFQSHLCYLPDPIRPIVWYGVFAGLSFGSLFLCTVFPRQLAVLQRLLSGRLTSPMLPLAENARLKAKSRRQRVIGRLLDWRLPERASIRDFFLNGVPLLVFVLLEFRYFYAM